MFFTLFRTRLKLSSAGAGHSFLRIMLVLVVFMGTVCAFWINSERYVYKFGAGARFEDKLGAFSREQRDAMVNYITRFEKKYDVKLYVQTRKDIFTSVDAQGKGIFLGICPSNEQVVVFLPPLWRNPLLDGVAAQMRGEIASAGFDGQEWTEGVVKSLSILEAYLNSSRLTP